MSNVLKALCAVGFIIGTIDCGCASDVNPPRDDSFTSRTVAVLVANMKNGDFTVPNPEVIKAVGQGYVPAGDEPSVRKLVVTYKMYGQSRQFWDAMSPLCYRGNPNAWCYWGTHLASNNRMGEDDIFLQGVALLMMASITGSLQADNMLGSFLNIMNKPNLSLSYYQKGQGYPFCDVNYGLTLGNNGYTPEVIAILERAANAGDPAGASALTEAHLALGNKVDALKWLYISYRGLMSMDRFYGIVYLLDCLNKNPLTPAEGQQAQESVAKWFSDFPGVLLDGFDEDIYGARPLYKLDEDYDPPVDSSTLISCFWTTYAVGKKDKFRETLEAFLDPVNPVIPNADWNNDNTRIDARAVLAYLLQGFGGPRDQSRRDELLKAAARSYQPLAVFDSYFSTIMHWAFQGDLSKGYQVAFTHLQCIDTWFPNEPAYNNAFADATFLLGYVTYNGIGTTKDEAKGLEIIQKVRYLSALAFGFMGALEKDLVESYAQLLAVYPNFTIGDSFNGFSNSRALKNKLTKEQRVEAEKKAEAYCKKYPMITSTIYSRYVMGLGLNYAFGKR